MILCIGAGIIVIVVMYVLRRHSIGQKIRSPCRILLVFCVLGILSEVAGNTESGTIGTGRIARNTPGEGELETEAILYIPEEDTEYEMMLTIPERKYQKAEEQKFIAAAKEEIDQTFCGENTSLDEIISDPEVEKEYQNGAVTAEWTFSDEEIISSEGKIMQSALNTKKKRMEAYVWLSCGEREEEYSFVFWILPRQKSREEQIALAVEEEIALQAETEAVVELPDIIDGKHVEWKQTPMTQSAEILGLGILAAVASAYVAKEQEEKKMRKRKQSLMLAYPEFVSKLSLLLGAGMTISNALRKMNQMYQRKQARNSKKEPVYEELYCMICEMDNGMGEMRAYQQFSERCDLQPYRKLVSLLISGQKVGNRRLMEQLNEEADRVFSERKNAARRLGEEAGTKMLFPMMLMLVIVMGIVMVPAFLSIYGT